jgi:hypothetical protein
MKKVVIAVDVASLKSNIHKHHRKDGWFSIYYYKKSRKTQAKVAMEKCTSFKSYRDDTFYKCQALSQKDNLFDYYKIKKQDIDKRYKNFAKKKGNGRHGKSHKIDYSGPCTVKHGSFILHF